MGDMYSRQYNFPRRIESLRRKMRALEIEAEAVAAKDILQCLRASNEAWDREVEIARLQQAIRKGAGQ